VDSDLMAAVVGAVVAGVGGWFVPRLVARIPEVEPETEGGTGAARASTEADPDLAAGAVSEPHARSEQDAAVTAPSNDDPPEPFARIAALPGLAWRSAVVAASAGAVLGAAIGWHWAWVMWVPLVPAYVALGLVDWRTRLLPTYVIARLYVVLVAVALVGWAVTRDTGSVVHAALGWLTYGGLFVVLWFIYPRGLGYGDVRLSGVLGIALGWLGWGPVLVGLYAGLILGGVLGLVLSLLKIVDRKNNPFGPSMLVGAVVGVLWGGSLWSGLYGG
jgi:leader peptidase (prepilin peptidase) / N-methyltransferase